MRLDALTPTIDAEPGVETAAVVRVSNDRTGPARYSIRVHGLGGDVRSVDVPGDPVAPGDACELEIRLAVPQTIGSGSHSVAIEIHSDRPDESAGLVDDHVGPGPVGGRRQPLPQPQRHDVTAGVLELRHQVRRRGPAGTQLRHQQLLVPAVDGIQARGADPRPVCAGCAATAP